MLSGITTAIYAQQAPVYDVDNVTSSEPTVQSAPSAPAPSVSAPAPAQSSVVTSGTSTQVEVAAPSGPPLSSLSEEQRIQRLEQQITNLQHSDSATKSEALQTEVQTLRGQVEELTHQLQEVQTQQRTMYSDLDKRLSATPAAVMPATVDTSEPKTIPKQKAAALKAKVATPAVAATPAKVTAQPNVAEEQQIYQTAYDLIKVKKYNQAITALQGMIQKYPTGQFAANAHYWLGELYGLVGKNDQSATEFSNVVTNYPESPKVSDAQLKLGLIYAAQFKWSDARSAFKDVINHYPGTASARLASEQLKQIKQSGH